MLATMRTPTSLPAYDGRHVLATEYFRLPDDGFRYELIDGVMRVTPSPLFSHGGRVLRFGRLLVDFLDEHPIGDVTTETDIRFDEHTVLRPDIAFVRAENYAIIRGHIYGVPDLVCEVLSDATRRHDLGRKAELYLRFGVREYWVVDPKRRKFERRHVKDGVWVLEHGAARAKMESAVLPGFVVDGERLFGGGLA